MKIYKQLLNLRDTLKIMRGNLNSAYTGLKYLEDACNRLDLMQSITIDIDDIKERVKIACEDSGLYEYKHHEDFYDEIRGEILAHVNDMVKETLNVVYEEALKLAEHQAEELAPPEESEALTLEERNK